MCFTGCSPHAVALLQRAVGRRGWCVRLPERRRLQRLLLRHLRVGQECRPDENARPSLHARQHQQDQVFCAAGMNTNLKPNENKVILKEAVK